MRIPLRYTVAVCACFASMAMLAQTAAPARVSARAAMKAASAPVDSLVWAYLKYDAQLFDPKQADELERCIVLAPGLASVQLPASAISMVAQQEGVVYVQGAEKVKQMLDIAREEVNVEAVNSGEGLDNPYTGQGVVVGVVDAGFDYMHASFYDADGNLRISRVWEQSTDPYDDYYSPEDFGYGIELDTPELIIGAAGDITGNSHGTHVTAIAAGSVTDEAPQYAGMAPDAEIVLVSMGESSRDNVNISNGVAYIFNYAEQVGKPCVVNLSLGTHSGPHDGTSTFDTVLDALQGPGRVVVGSAGNDRAGKFHIKRTFTEESTDTLSTFLDFLSTIKTEGEVEIWASEGMSFQANLVVYNTYSKTVAEAVQIYPTTEQLTSVGLGRNVSGTISVAYETSALNGKEHLLLTTALTSIRTNYAIAIEIIPESAGQVDLWADDSALAFTSKNIDGFVEPAEEDGTISEIGGTSNNILTVGAYTTRNEYVLLNEEAVNTLSETIGDLASFSAYGPTADGRQKPEVTAPGCIISSAISYNDGSGTTQVSYSIVESDEHESMFGYMQGTSMSSPMVAGIVATWLQACPTLTPDDLKEIVKNTSVSDDFTGELPSAMWGYGKVDALAGLRSVLEMNSLSAVTVNEANAIFRYGRNGVEAILADYAATASLNIYNPNGTIVGSATKNNVAAGESITMDLSGLAPGIYILHLTTPSGTKSLKLGL